MNRLRNPFTPSFGKVPPFMAGRDQVVNELVAALDNGIGDPNLSTIFIGARGTGKTALLSRISNEAQQHGWISVDVSARPGMLESILLRTQNAAAHLLTAEAAAKIKGIQLGQILGVEWENADQIKTDWRIEMERLLDKLNAQDVGLLITVDEVRADLDEMIELVSIYQHFVREDCKVALFMAGSPFKVSELLSEEDISFLRRAQHKYFEKIADFEIADALQKTIVQGGRSIGEDALDLAIKAIEGFPYMMQLVGYRAWAQNPQRREITCDDIRAGVNLAQKEIVSGIFETTYRELSAKDKEFLFAMLEDESESSVADVAQRMGVKSNYAGQYKRRLLERGVIGERGRGVVGFELPGFRNYLIERKS